MMEQFHLNSQRILENHDQTIFKNLFFNNFFYFSTFKINFSDFNYFIKITNLKTKIKNENLLTFTKPYSILNYIKTSTQCNMPYILIFHSIFKQYQTSNSFSFKIIKTAESGVITENFNLLSLVTKFSFSQTIDSLLFSNSDNDRIANLSLFSTIELIYRPITTFLITKIRKYGYFNKKRILRSFFYRKYRHNLYDDLQNISSNNNNFLIRYFIDFYQEKTLNVFVNKQSSPFESIEKMNTFFYNFFQIQILFKVKKDPDILFKNFKNPIPRFTPILYYKFNNFFHLNFLNNFNFFLKTKVYFPHTTLNSFRNEHTYR